MYRDGIWYRILCQNSKFVDIIPKQFGIRYFILKKISFDLIISG